MQHPCIIHLPWLWLGACLGDRQGVILDAGPRVLQSQVFDGARRLDTGVIYIYIHYLREIPCISYTPH